MSSFGKVLSVNELVVAGSATRALLHYKFHPSPSLACKQLGGWKVWSDRGMVVVLTLGMLSLVQTHSESSRSLISHAKIEGHSRLYSAIFCTTWGVATRGLEPPMARGLMEPVS